MKALQLGKGFTHFAGGDSKTSPPPAFFAIIPADIQKNKKIKKLPVVVYRGPVFKGAFPLCIDRILGPDRPQPPRTGGQTGGGIGEETPSGGGVEKPRGPKTQCIVLGAARPNPSRFPFQMTLWRWHRGCAGGGGDAMAHPAPPLKKKTCQPKTKPLPILTKKKGK